MPYSTLFGTGTPPSSAETIYTVPPGFAAVLRDIEYLNYSGATATASVSATVPGPLSAIAWYDDSVASGVSVRWSGRVVLPEGSEVQWFSTTSSSVMTISGYLLSAP